MIHPECRQHNLLYNVHVGTRYHMRRQAFFERWHRLTGIISLVGGSAAVATMTTPVVATVFAAVIAITQAIDLTVDTRKYAEVHKDLRRRYTELDAILTKKNELTDQECSNVNTKIKMIEVEEPPLKMTLLSICQNDTLTAWDYADTEAPTSYTPVGFFGKMFAQFV